MVFKHAIATSCCAFVLSSSGKPISSFTFNSSTRYQHNAYGSFPTIALSESSDNVDDASPLSSSASPTPQLSKQDAILQAALGIEPETEADKAERLKAVQQSTTSSNTPNIIVACLSFVAALGNYFYLYTNPVTDVQLLYSMSQSSCPVTEIGQNGKPTVVDFWAPWCDNCKRSAPTLALIEKEYGDQVNFVMVNGDLPENWDMIEKFQVDAIPHLALVSRDGDIETALIGPVPSSVLRADLDVLSSSTEKSTNLRDALPYKMFDPFQGKDEVTRRVQFNKMK